MPRRPHHPTRREVLEGAAAGLAVACAGGKGDTGESALVPGRIDTVVFVMFENRSFDHWFGARKPLEGKDEDGLTDGMSNPDADGNPVYPFPTDTPCLYDPPHGWDASHSQWNNGANDGFVTQYAEHGGGDGSGIMGYQTRDTVPISWALADAFLQCDHWHAAVMGPTWPNRLYAHMASSQGKTDNSLPTDDVGFTDYSLWNALDDAGIDWRYYYGDLPFIGLLKDTFDAERCLLVEQFYEDAKYGRLPPVCWVDPSFSFNDNHPPHHPGAGELLLASIYEALAASPQWNRLLLIVTYDEHGGFFDHVPPPTIDDDRADEGFDRLGFRVPALVIGPWVRQGVDSTVYNHPSWIRFVCDLYGIEPWNKRLWASDPLSGVLDTDRMASGVPLEPVVLPDFSFDPSTLSPDCRYGTMGLSPFPPKAPHDRAIESAVRRFQAMGLPARAPDEARAAILAAWREQGLLL